MTHTHPAATSSGLPSRLASDGPAPSPATGKPGSDIRWAFLEPLDVGTEGDPYLDRLRLVQTPWFGVYLHHIHRADLDRDPHDHPWAFASLVLAGGYRERVWPDKRDSGRSAVRHRGRWSLQRTGRDAAHIIEVVDGLLWTLVVTGPRRGGWGFWRDGQFTPWHEYQYAAANRAGNS